MSALLRSARLLKSSPISLFQIAGANIRGSALSRLYSGALVGRGVRVNPRQSSFALGVNRFAWPLAAARHTGVAPRQESESRYQGTSVVRARQGMQFDEAVTRLNRIVRRSGRITKTLLMTIFHDSCRSGFPSGNLALLLLRSCGSLLAEVHPSERTEIVHKIWDKLREMGMTYDISHYNTLLKVYLQNEHKFSVTEFLAKMEAAKIQPNRVMYQSLVAVYCQEGDIEGAGKILECMKSAEMPISEAIFNSLITGHSRAGDMESAQDMLEVMKAAGIEPGSESYLALLNAYVEKADMEHFKELLEAMNRSDVFLMDNELMEVLFTLAKAGHHQHIPEILALMSLEHGYLADAMNLCLRLLNLDLEDTVMTFLKTFPLFLNEEGEIGEPGSFLLRHCVYKNKPIEKIQQCCRELQEAQLHSTPLQYSLQCALEANKAGLALQLMKMMKLEEGLPVRPHYFWPLLAQLQKENNKQGALEILKNMEELGVPANVETFQRYILPYYSSTESAYSELKEAGYEVDTADFTAAQLRVESINGNLERVFSLCALEILKNMEELGVPANVETFQRYILPYYSSTESAYSELKLRVESINGNLERVFSLLSSYTLPALNLITFRGSLTTGFRMSSDPDIMAKITALLFKDKRFCLEKSTPNENGSNFVHSLISGMPADEIRAQEEKLRQYLNQLKSMGITIQGHHYKGIHMALNQTNLPQLQQAALELVDLNGINNRPRMPRVATGVKVPLLERKLEEAQAAGEPVGPLLKALISALCENADLTRALELKARHQADMPVQAYISLLNCCCQHDMVEQALSLKAELLEKDPSLVMTDRKYLVLIRALAKRKMLDEAVDLLREMKEKSVPITSKNYSFFHLLNFLALQGDEEGPSNVMCSPPITLHLTKGDYVAALEAVLMCLQQYSLLPRLHDVLCGLVEKGEKEHLQRVMNLVSTEWGERTMLYDLFFAFLQTGRFKEARKIIESPGMIARPGRLQWFAEKCVVGNHVETLDNLVDMTVKLYECDRDDMYNFVFRLCHFNNDWEKALATWTKMQEENVVPRERTQLLLARILKNNGQEVPFVMPEVWYEKFATAFTTLKEAVEKNIPLSAATYTRVIKALLAGATWRAPWWSRTYGGVKNPSRSASHRRAVRYGRRPGASPCRRARPSPRPRPVRGSGALRHAAGIHFETLAARKR
ncbi:hypothetical protein COCON_G00225660 [Conger conger]|uniref:PROP1-like PPR domain-containing protein n=1 Tax=Conger conger TaxID=82655 RepID=A0A9Q1CWW3_CONCO|nr:hypothetical protein COCON_G00225660 [Conger conger]